MEADAPRRRWPLQAALLVLAAGLYFAGYLAYLKLKLTFPDPDFKSFCNVGSAFDCDEVQRHSSSMFFGIPIAVLAIPTYLVLGWLAAVGLRGKKGSGVAVSYMAFIGLFTVAYAAYLGYLSHFEIGTFCLFCMSMYAVQLLATVFAFVARGIGFRGVIAEVFTSLTSFQGPIASSAVIGLVALGGAYGAYTMAYGEMSEAETARVAAEMAAMEGGAVEVAPGADDANDGATPADAAAGAAAKGAGAATAAAKPKPAPRPARKPKLTDNGYDWFDVPVGEGDHVLGPIDAPVTIVSFKDFECGFCRFVASQEKPLKKRYADKVRFVFKHYPMNSDCNYRMGSTRMHDGACRAAYASICAEEQDKFWDMYDVLWKNQKKFSDEQLRGYAEKLGLDLAKYDACYASDRPKKKIEEDVRLAARMRIIGTPRLYINNRLVTGSTATDVLDYYVQMALKAGEAAPATAEARVATNEDKRMVQMTKAAGPFWIDAFESSIDGKGKAVSVPGVKPALASWFDAKAACDKAGKRMCTEEEWVSACTGEAAVDHGKNGNWTSGPVSGRLYPYGAFFEQGACRDSEDKYTGAAAETGKNAQCRTAEGVYDLTGNLYEWVGAAPEEATMIGGDWRSGSGASCRRRTRTYGAGIKNDTTGFRCCADAEVADVATSADVKSEGIPEAVGGKVPADLVLETTDGGKLSPRSFKGKVTYLTFFASWCSNCRKQMPAIKAWEDEWKSKGFQIVAINVDRVQKKAEDYITKLEPNFTVALDPMARTMSDFDINAMPTSFIIGKDGVIKKRVVGYKDKEIEATRKTILDLLGG